LTVFDSPEGMSGRWNYCTALFAPETLERFTGHFLTLLSGILENPDKPLAYLPLLTSADLGILAQWNATGQDYPEFDDSSVV